MLIADESVNNNLIVAMRNAGHDVFSIRDDMRSEEDVAIAAFSLMPPRIIVTEDKDFGEIVYHKNLKVSGVILLRYLPFEYEVIKNKLLAYLAAHINNSVGKLVAITDRLTRVSILPT